MNKKLCPAIKKQQEIKAVRAEKEKLFAKMKIAQSKGELRKLAIEVTEIEFSLQRLFGLPESENWHQWYNLPQCACPKMDNADRRGTNWRVYSENCSIHGTYETEDPYLICDVI